MKYIDVKLYSLELIPEICISKFLYASIGGILLERKIVSQGGEGLKK